MKFVWWCIANAWLVVVAREVVRTLREVAEGLRFR